MTALERAIGDWPLSLLGARPGALAETGEALLLNQVVRQTAGGSHEPLAASGETSASLVPTPLPSIGDPGTGMSWMAQAMCMRIAMLNWSRLRWPRASRPGTSCGDCEPVTGAL